MKDTVYYLKLNEQQVKQLISEQFAAIGCDSVGQGYEVTYHIEFTYGENGELSAQCIMAMNNGFEKSIDVPTDDKSVSELETEYEKANLNYIHFHVDSDILKSYIVKSLSWKIKGKPKKSLQFVAAKFYGAFHHDFRCLVAMSDREIKDEHFNEIDKISLCVESFDQLQFQKYEIPTTCLFNRPN